MYKTILFGYNEQKPYKLLSHPCFKSYKTSFKETILQVYMYKTFPTKISVMITVITQNLSLIYMYMQHDLFIYVMP